MFKKVTDLFKKKPSSPVEKKTREAKPSPPKAEEVSAPSGEAAPSTVSEKPREQRPVSVTSEEGASKELKEPTESKKTEEPKKSEELKEPEKPKTSALKPEESKEPKTTVSQDQSPMEKPTVASSKEAKEVKGEKETAETAEEKPAKTDSALQPKETVDAVSGPESSGETSSPDSEKKPPSQTAPEPKKPQRETVKLQGLFAFKMSMTSLYDEEGRRVPVTALKYNPWVVSQIKTREKEGYSAVQLACGPQKNNRSTRPLIKHLAPAGFKEGARYIREIRQDLPENIKVGQELSIESLKKGDRVRISSRSKGRGYAGVVKRWGFRGGPASHGSKTHRKTGSIGQCTEPSRVFPGRKMPGQYGFKTNTLNSVPVVDVLPSEGMIFIKGPVSGSRNTLVSLKKVEEARV